MQRRKKWLWISGGALGVCLVAVAVLYFMTRDSVNFTGFVGEGGETGVQVPPGFAVNVYAAGLNGPRFMAFGPDDALYVADRGNDRIVSLHDVDGDGASDEMRVFAEDLPKPHSLVYHEGAWFVGVPTGVIRLEDTDGDGQADSREVLVDDYPARGHSTRTVEFLPDGRMVVSVGSSCNVCDEDDARRAAVLVYDGPGASGERVLASGLRNAVGLAVHPQSGELWATNNGRDGLGDDVPPETLYVVQEGVDYGWPRCHSGRIVDPDFGFAGACDDAGQPLVEMQAHSAPLGLVFYTGQAFPEAYRGDLFIAFHGSWNRSIPTGYKVVRLPLDGSQPTGPVEDFATGWMDEESYAVSGRPVGLVVGPDGALYVSDDKAGFIYRIAYVGE